MTMLQGFELRFRKEAKRCSRSEPTETEQT